MKAKWKSVAHLCSDIVEKGKLDVSFYTSVSSSGTDPIQHMDTSRQETSTMQEGGDNPL